MTAVTVFYNDDFRIVGLAGIPDDPDAPPALRPMAGTRSATVQLTDEQAGLPLTAVLTQFRVELGEARLVPITGEPAAAQAPAEPEPVPTRYEAVVLTSSTRLALADVADLDLDRLPDRGGSVRVLVSAEEARELTDRGYEVRLVNTLKTQPLDPGLVMDDEQAEAWLEARTAHIEQREVQ